jgi:hypothetical protein
MYDDDDPAFYVMDPWGVFFFKKPFFFFQRESTALYTMRIAPICIPRPNFIHSFISFDHAT